MPLKGREVETTLIHINSDMNNSFFFFFPSFVLFGMSLLKKFMYFIKVHLSVRETR